MRLPTYMGRAGLASEARRAPAVLVRLNRLVASGAVLALAGCGSTALRNPVQWWHEREGGAIARQRPPPPNIDAPYPNLGSVPPKPDMPDPAARQRLTAALLAARANAQYEAKLAPLSTAALAPVPAATKASPVAPDPNSASASLAAATAPAGNAPAQPVPAPAPLPSFKTELSGPMPPIPDAPPPPPRFAGIDIPATKPTPPPVAPPEPPKPEVLGEAASVPLSVGFRANSAVLFPPDEAALKALAKRRGKHRIEVVGFGDTSDATPQVQGEGIALALARARAMAAALTAEDVPVDAIRMSAQAAGRGGAARLIE